VDNYGSVLGQAEKIAKKKSKNPLYENVKWIREVLDQPVYRDARKITVYDTDDLETLLSMGQEPVPHCQNWKVDSSLNVSLLSFVADANKKLYYIKNGNNKPISMSLVRLVEWQEMPTLLIENVYDNEWSDDYGVALLGSIAETARDLYENSRKNIVIATTNHKIKNAMEKFSEQYEVEIHNDYMSLSPAESKNTCEYWDCGPGLVESGQDVSFSVDYIVFGK